MGGPASKTPPRAGLAGLAPADMPFVSLCTPTFNRRPFLPALQKCVQQQTYPAHRMEWVVVDDGSDRVEDFFLGAPSAGLEVPVQYHFEGNGTTKLSLGAKRNRTNALARGDILVYLDDDDYYPPTRVWHAVDMLLRHPEYQIAGTKIIHVYYPERQRILRYGPYADMPEFASAATFAFWRAAFLADHRFDDAAALAEESAFTGHFTAPMLALDPQQTILVFQHDQNSFDKRWALRAGPSGNFTATELELADFVRGPAAAELLQFFVDEVHGQLAEYAPGCVTRKPDVLAALAAMGKLTPAIRARMEPAAAAALAAEEEQKYVVNAVDEQGATRRLSGAEIKAIVDRLEAELRDARAEIAALVRERDAFAARLDAAKQPPAAAAPAGPLPLTKSPEEEAAAAENHTAEQLVRQYERCLARMACEARGLALPKEA